MSNQYDTANAAERAAAQKMELGGYKTALIVAIVAWVAYLVLPYAGTANGWEVLGLDSPSVKISIMENISGWCALLGIGVLTSLTVITRRLNFGLAAWMLVAISLFLNLWGFWYRGSTADGASIGMWVGVLASLIAFLAYCRVAFRRSPEQIAAAEKARAAASSLDQVGVLQTEAATTLPPEENPLLIDDRRRRAHKR
ncbi:Rv2732c family membrane protein [Corynebacterium simulans]